MLQLLPLAVTITTGREISETGSGIRLFLQHSAIVAVQLATCQPLPSVLLLATGLAPITF